MTREEIIKSAGDNGYDSSGKTDEQLISDEAFFKAACDGKPPQTLIYSHFDSPCPNCGTRVEGVQNATADAWMVMMFQANCESKTELKELTAF